MQTNRMFLYIQEITMKSTWQFFGLAQCALGRVGVDPGIAQ